MPLEAAPDVSIILPCLNEAATLRAVIESAQRTLGRLAEQGLTGEIVVVDNGSTDESAAVARESGARVVFCPDRGYGHAVVQGARSGRGHLIILSDADGSYDLREALPMVQRLREGFDVCLGSRFKGQIRPGAMSFKNRYIGNPALTGILNLLFRSGLSDAHCGLRAFTRSAFERMRLSSPGMELASEMVVKATLAGLKRIEVPVTLHPDGRGRPSHLVPWRDGWRHLKLMLLHCPLWPTALRR